MHSLSSIVFLYSPNLIIVLFSTGVSLLKRFLQSFRKVFLSIPARDVNIRFTTGIRMLRVLGSKADKLTLVAHIFPSELVSIASKIYPSFWS